MGRIRRIVGIARDLRKVGPASLYLAYSKAPKHRKVAVLELLRLQPIREQEGVSNDLQAAIADLIQMTAKRKLLEE